MELAVLPEHLVYEILLLLPVKSLLSFRTLSRHWNDTLSSCKFSMDHCQRSRDIGKQGNYYVISYSCVANSITLYPETGKSFKLDFSKVLRNFDDKFFIQSSCRGIICAMFHGLSSTYVILWNPVTREFGEILDCGETFGSGYSKTGVKFAFGFDSATDDYKVVRMTSSKDTHRPNRQIDVLSLKTKSVKTTEYQTQYTPSKNSVSVDGYIFWLANGPQNTQAILKLNLTDDQLSQILIPSEAITKTTQHEQVRLSLHECNGNVKLVRFELHEDIHWCVKCIWLLSIVDETWKDVSSCYKAALGKLFRGWDGPIGLTLDSVIVIERKGCCDEGREEGVERVRVGGLLKDGTNQFLHWESLVSPLW